MTVASKAGSPTCGFPRRPQYVRVGWRGDAITTAVQAEAALQSSLGASAHSRSRS